MHECLVGFIIYFMLVSYNPCFIHYFQLPLITLFFIYLDIPTSDYQKILMTVCIHVILSWTQIGRFGLRNRILRSEIGRFLARLHEVQKSYCSHPGRTRSRSRYRSRSRHTLLKFSRSLYLDNQLSESIHTWTIGTL